MKRAAYYLILVGFFTQSAGAFECTRTPDASNDAPSFLSRVDSALAQSDDALVLGVLRNPRRSSSTASNDRVGLFSSDLEVIETFGRTPGEEMRTAQFILAESRECETAIPDEQPRLMSLTLKDGVAYIKAWWPYDREAVELLRILTRKQH